MNEILAYLVAHCSFLWDRAAYQITGSEVTRIQGGDAWLEIRSSSLQLRFVRDRGQLFLDLRGADHADQDDAWYSLDLVWRLLLGERRDSSELDAGYALFLGERLTQIEALFADDNWPRTRDELRRLKRLRAREMFG